MTSEERLNRIKSHAETDVIEWDENRTVERVDWLFEGDFDWLVQQAEKAEMLEKRMNEIAINNYCIECGDIAVEERHGQFYCERCGG